MFDYWSGYSQLLIGVEQLRAKEKMDKCMHDALAVTMAQRNLLIKAQFADNLQRGLQTSYGRARTNTYGDRRR